MEELSTKQIKTIKATYTLSIIYFYFSILVVLSMVSEYGNIFYYPALLYFLLVALVFIVVYWLKSSKRKLIISILYLIFSLILLEDQVNTLITVYSQQSLFNNALLDILNDVVMLTFGITFFILAFYLISKLKGKNINPVIVKVLFGVFLSSCSLYYLVFFGRMALGGLPFGIIYFALFFFILYKSLTDKGFYKNFIEAHPKLILKQKV